METTQINILGYREIEDLIEANKIEELLQSYNEIFTVVHYYEQLLMASIISTPNETDNTMKKLGACYSSLNRAYMMLDTLKQKKESEIFLTKKIELEKENKKIVAAVVEREVSAEVNVYRRVRNIFFAYKESCDRIISICQSSLKYSDHEIKMRA